MRRFPECLSAGRMGYCTCAPGEIDAAARRDVYRTEPGAGEICRIAPWSVHGRSPPAARGRDRHRAGEGAGGDERCGADLDFSSLVYGKKKQARYSKPIAI